MNNRIIALIPARSGSKGIPDKNIRIYKEKPLIAHSIEIAKSCSLINEVYVSTDSPNYAKIAEEYGAKVPFLRPANIADDLSPDIDSFKHFLEYYKKEYPESDDKNLIFVHLRPTYPNRTIQLLTDSINKFLEVMDKYDSLRTVIPIDKTPCKMYYINNNELIPYFKEWSNIKEPYNQARQLFPQTYLHNGCIDIVKSEVIKSGMMSGEKIFPYLMSEDENNDIDTEADLIRSQNKR